MYSVIVRYGSMNNIGTFRAERSEWKRGDKCVVKSDRGTELGEIISSAEELAKEDERSTSGRVLRIAGKDDFEQSRRIEEEVAPEQAKFCRKAIQDHKLPMRLVSVEHLLGGEKVIFYFVSEGRVDFRELVRDLARQYKTRIEMRQIGVRDEARILADYEHCGRELCCRSFIKTLEPVTMKMAKNQKATLDPAKISGRCGRLMCCLRYEDKTYEELKRKLPKRGSRVITDRGKGDVIKVEVLAQTVLVEMEGGTRETLRPEDIRKVIPKGKRR